MSCAYILGCEKYRQFGRLLVYNRKSKGPRIVPWGTPHLTKARFKRRILHVPNLMQMTKIYCFRSFALDSAHVKCDV